jgi:hypothetical protein
MKEKFQTQLSPSPDLLNKDAKEADLSEEQENSTGNKVLRGVIHTTPRIMPKQNPITLARDQLNMVKEKILTQHDPLPQPTTMRAPRL